MKTATVDSYHLFGTNSGRGVRLMYRGRVLMHLTGHSSENPRMLGACLKRAHADGFTHTRDLASGRVTPIDPAIATWSPAS